MVSYDTLELRLFKMPKYGNRKYGKFFIKPLASNSLLQA